MASLVASAVVVVGLAAWVALVAGRSERPLVVVLVGAVAVAAVAAAVATRHRWVTWLPFVTLPAMFAAVGMGGIPDDGGKSDSPFVLLVMWSTYLAGRHGVLRWQPWTAGLGLLFVVAAAGGGDSASDVVFPLIMFFGPWLAGLSLQTLAAQADRARGWAVEAEAAREREVQHAVLEERLEIARELHDMVAHSISALSLQAQVVRRRIEAGQPVDAEHVRSIEATAQQSMTDLRRLLGLLRPADDHIDLDPQASFEDLPGLLGTAQAAGQLVLLEEVGTRRALAPATSLAAYRIVQEALTNARRHGAPGPTQVRVNWGETAVEIEVVNPVQPGQQRGQAGHGLLGMSERARLFGGVLTAEARDGCWVVHSTLPARALEPSSR